MMFAVTALVERSAGNRRMVYFITTLHLTLGMYGRITMSHGSLINILHEHFWFISEFLGSQ
jgi:hypothetical protein